MSKEFKSYEEILKMDEEQAKEVFLLRHTVDFMSLLLEMIEHEEKTGSFQKTAKGEITPEQRLLIDVFDRDKAMEVAELFRKIDNVLEDNESEQTKLMDNAIFAKFSSDFTSDL